MTMEKKMAGFSMAAHRMYRKGWEKNRGAMVDILSVTISIFSRWQEVYPCLVESQLTHKDFLLLNLLRGLISCEA